MLQTVTYFRNMQEKLEKQFFLKSIILSGFIFNFQALHCKRNDFFNKLKKTKICNCQSRFAVGYSNAYQYQLWSPEKAFKSFSLNTWICKYFFSTNNFLNYEFKLSNLFFDQLEQSAQCFNVGAKSISN